MAWFSYVDDKGYNRLINTSHILDVVFNARSREDHKAIITLAPPTSFTLLENSLYKYGCERMYEVEREKIVVTGNDAKRLARLMDFEDVYLA